MTEFVWPNIILIGVAFGSGPSVLRAPSAQSVSDDVLTISWPGDSHQGGQSL
jgi:hypothetical protein